MRRVIPHDFELDDDQPTQTFDRSHFAALGLQIPPAPERPIAPIPPPLPMVLRKRIAWSDQEWLESLPAESRAVLDAAAMPARPWPYAERIAGAVCTPIE